MAAHDPHISPDATGIDRREFLRLSTAVAAAGALAGQGRSVAIVGPTGNPLREATPRFVISTSGFTAADAPVRLRVQVALSADFAAPFFADTTVTGTSALNAGTGDIALNNATNNFVGTVSSTGVNVSLTDGTGGLVLGVTLAAMFLGHWYLNTPTMQLVPLKKLVVLMNYSKQTTLAIKK